MDAGANVDLFRDLARTAEAAPRRRPTPSPSTWPGCSPRSTTSAATWNAVTSVSDGEARNVSRDAHLDHGTRYDRAAEFLDAACALWDTWPGDAVVLDRAGSITWTPRGSAGPTTPGTGSGGRAADAPPVAAEQAGDRAGRGRPSATTWASSGPRSAGS